MKKTNWDRLQKKPVDKSVKYRDVYEDQQLDRSEIQEKQTMTSRTVLVIILTLLVGAITYFTVSAGAVLLDKFSSLGATEETANNADAPPEHNPGGVPENWTDIVTEDGLRYQDEYGNIHTQEEAYAQYEVEYQQKLAEYNATHGVTESSDNTGDVTSQNSFSRTLAPTPIKIGITLIVMILFFAAMEQYMLLNLKAQNLMNDMSDINQYTDDQHVQLPEELQRAYDFFPDVGAHSSVQVSSMLSHMMLANKGIKHIDMPVRAKANIMDENGDVEFYEGEIVYDENDQATYQSMPFFDKEFAEALYDASGMLKDKMRRKYYDATRIPYNKKNENRDKVKDCDTVADLINKDWILPEYEPQRPAGAYIVDTQPVNTMV